MVRNYRRRRRFKPGRYILLLLILCGVAYSLSSSPEEGAGENSVAQLKAVGVAQAQLPPEVVPPTVVAPVSEPSTNVAEAQPPEDKAREEEEGRPRSFSMMDEIDALEAIDIVAIEKLEVRPQREGYALDARLVFVNENIFPVKIADSQLEASLALDEKTLLPLGSLRIQDLLLPASSKKERVGTATDVKVNHGKSLDPLRNAMAGDFPAANEERFKVPLFVKGRLVVQIPLVGGMSVERAIKLNFEYQPEMTAELFRSFRQSIRLAQEKSLPKG